MKNINWKITSIKKGPQVNEGPGYVTYSKYNRFRCPGHNKVSPALPELPDHPAAGFYQQSLSDPD